MHSNQTIQLKPAYQHPHISLYNTPLIGNAVSGFSLAPDVHFITTNGASINNEQDLSNFNTIATLQGIPTSATTSANCTPRIVHPVTTANSVCLSSIPIQQLQVHQTNGQILQTKFNTAQQKTGQILQVQITTPQIAPTASVAMIDMSASGQNVVGQITMRPEPASNSNPQDGPSSSSRSSSSTSDVNFNDAISSDNSRDTGSRTKAIGSTRGAGGRTNNNVNFVSPTQSSSSSGNSSVIKMNSSNEDHAINLRSTNSRGFKCQICNRDFTQKGNLKTHLMTHSGERPYECPTCGKNFTQKGNLDTHVKIHTETKDHKCQYCDRGFTQRGNLKTHIRSVHTKEKPYSCIHCGKCFSQKGNMLTHFRTHDKEARFPCNICGKTFSQKVSKSNPKLVVERLINFNVQYV